MIVKLKPLNEIIEEFGFKKDKDGDYYISTYNKFNEIVTMYIVAGMFKYFGETIKVEKIKKFNVDHYFYTHKAEGYNFHEDWFEQLEEFFKEDEFIL